MNFFENDCGFGNAQARAAVFLWDQRGHVAGAGERLNEGLRIRALGIEIAPVGVREAAAKFSDSSFQLLVKFEFVGSGHF
jgi:hypothetical protein